MKIKPWWRQACLAVMAVALTGISNAEEAMTYQTPPKAMADLVDAPRQPAAIVAHDSRHIAFARFPGILSLADVAKLELKLAGIRINPAKFAPSRDWPIEQLEIKALDSDKQFVVSLPSTRLFSPSWSPDSRHLAVIVEESDGLYPWVVDVESQKARRLSKTRMNASLGIRYQWSHDGKGLLLPQVVLSEKERPKEGGLPAGPVVQESTGEKAPVRTYQDLLKNPQDEALFSYYATSQLVFVPLKGKERKLGAPGIQEQFAQSPDGEYVLVERIQRPFSYLVPYDDFPTSVEVWDKHGKLLKQLALIPAKENLPQGFDSVVTGPRAYSWRADEPATLVYAVAQDGGDMKKEVEVHDRLFTLSAPFTTEPQTLMDLGMRYAGITWGNDKLALVTEWRFSDRKLRTSKFAPTAPSEARVVFDERSYNDAYRDPGNPVMTLSSFNTRIIKVGDNQSMLLTGLGASPQGNIPFLDRHSFASGEKVRLWHSEAPFYERVAAVLDDEGKRLLTLRESPQIQPNFFLRDLSANSLKAISDFPHPTPAFANIEKELIKYKRKDGVELSGTLYLPPGYKREDGPLPVLMWAYPLEFKDAAVAGQVKDSPYEFNRVSYWGPLAHLAHGFAVFDDPKMPIIGQGKAQPNDNFREQLVNGAQAAVEVLVERGIADPKRIAIGGHSYGAFMTANLLAHSELFAAGIARSGAYNRTLTPFGFQGEERNFWEASDTYGAMSPFFHAEKINEPMLMIHGEEDNNSGTFPIQSQRMFAAIKGLGGRSRLVMLPHEQHGYRARESILHMLWEQYTWLETYVKKAE